MQSLRGVAYLLIFSMMVTIAGPSALALTNRSIDVYEWYDLPIEEELPFQEDENEESQKESSEKELEEYLLIFDSHLTPTALELRLLMTFGYLKEHHNPNFEITTPPPKGLG